MPGGYLSMARNAPAKERAMLPETRLFGLAVLAGALLMPALAAAQAPPRPTDRITPKEELSGPKDCVHTGDTTGKGIDIESADGRSLSDKLARSDGVICPPPRVDPEMTKPAPGGGVMPVIPPPGADEDHKGVEPK
jgi:hypothetical protein